MLRWGMAAIGLVATSVAGVCQTTPAPAPAAAAQPAGQTASPPPPPMVLPARHAHRAGSPGYSSGTPIVAGSSRIRVDSVGQVLTDELP